jgi:hypothetical protein
MKRIMTIAMLVVSCTSKVPEEKLNNEAIILHNSMVEKANLIKHRLNELKNDSAISQDSVTLLLELLKQWQRDLVEVPGNEEHGHANHDDHHSHHDHSVLDVTPEQMLEIQKELDARLSNIGKRTTSLKPDNEDEHAH